MAKYPQRRGDRGSPFPQAALSYPPSSNDCVIVAAALVAACADLSPTFYDYPAQKLGLIGVEETNGKTATTPPRTEDPDRILQDGVAGIPPMVKARVIGDRAQARQQAILAAKLGDGVFIAGKGHEDYQILGTEKSTLTITNKRGSHYICVWGDLVI